METLTQGRSYNGYHLYLSIANYRKTVTNAQEDNVVHQLLFALDHYVEAMQSFVSKLNETVISKTCIEKLTENRLHFVILDGPDILLVIESILAFSYGLVRRINAARKTESINALSLRAGLDYGYFVVANVFSGDNEQIFENNTVGCPANRAAKIEAKAKAGTLLASRTAFMRFRERQQRVIDFHMEDLFVDGEPLCSRSISTNAQLEAYAYLLNRFEQDINNDRNGDYVPRQTGARTSFSVFSSDDRPRKTKGAICLCDMRGSTKKLEKIANHLSSVQQFAQDTVASLKKMKAICESEDGHHVQFQGDREEAVFLEKISTEGDCVRNAIISAINVISCTDCEIGIGISYGSFYKIPVGKAREKYNLALGAVVNEANMAEDLGARDSGTIALTPEAYYQSINGKGKTLAFAGAIKELFKKEGNYFVYRNVNEEEFNRCVDKSMLHKTRDESLIKKDRPWLESGDSVSAPSGREAKKIIRKPTPPKSFRWIASLSRSRDWGKGYTTDSLNHFAKAHFQTLISKKYPLMEYHDADEEIPFPYCTGYSISAEDYESLMRVGKSDDIDSVCMPFTVVFVPFFRTSGVQVYDSYHVFNQSYLVSEKNDICHVEAAKRIKGEMIPAKICTHNEVDIKNKKDCTLRPIRSAKALYAQYRLCEDYGEDFELVCHPHGEEGRREL